MNQKNNVVLCPSVHQRGRVGNVTLPQFAPLMNRWAHVIQISDVHQWGLISDVIPGEGAP